MPKDRKRQYSTAPSSYRRQYASTVIPDIVPGVLWFTLIAVVVSTACHAADYAMKVNTIMLSVIGTMISFAIGLRTSSANARFDLGRTAWSGIQLASRQLAILIWIHVPETTLSKDKVKEVSKAELEKDKALCLLEKRTALNLVHAFAVATKHYLRGENGVYYEDLYPLCSALPKYSFPSAAHNPDADRSEILGLWRTRQRNGPVVDVPTLSKFPTATSNAQDDSHRASKEQDLEKGSTDVVHSVTLEPAFNPPVKTVYDYFPPLAIFKPVVRFFARGDRAQTGSDNDEEEEEESNIPLQISLFISAYIQNIFKRGTLVGQPNTYLSPVMALHNHLTTLERVLTTPLPYAYTAHLRLSVYIYLTFLPFQTYSLLGYLSIVVSAIASCIFLGFMELGRQLEDPFGYDDTDMPLDLYCKLIGEEIAGIIAHPVPDPQAYLFSFDNHPFLGDSRTAEEVYRDATAAWDAPPPVAAKDKSVEADEIALDSASAPPPPPPSGPPPAWHVNQALSRSHSSYTSNLSQQSARPRIVQVRHNSFPPRDTGK